MVSHGCGDHMWSWTSSKEKAPISNEPDSHCSSIGKYVIGSNGLGYDSIVFLTDLVLAIIVSWGLKIGKDSFSKKLPHYSPTGIIE